MEISTYEEIYNYIERGSYPTSFENIDINLLKDRKRNFRKKCQSFQVKDGLLYHIPTKSRPDSIREVPKVIDKERIIRAMHWSKAGGCHFGVCATFTKISERYWWKGMYNDILSKVNSCQECQQQNQIKKGPSELRPVNIPDRSFSQWGMDLIGPLNTTVEGNSYIIVFIEYLTRWAEAKGIPNKTAICTFSAILDLIISRFGAPEKIISDQGREFVNALNQLLFRELEIKHSMCSAYQSQSNGLTERFNQTLINQLRKPVNKNHDNWDKLISWILMSYRANRQASTKFSPYFLVYGIQMRLPIELDSSNVEKEAITELSENDLLRSRVTKLESLNTFRMSSKCNLTLSQENQKQTIRFQTPMSQI